MKDLRKILNSELKSLQEDYVAIIENSLDITYHTTINGDIVGFEVLLTYGGPTMVLEDNYLKISSMDKNDYLKIPDDLFNNIWDYVKELKNF